MQPSNSVSPTPEPSGYRVGDLLLDVGQQQVTRDGAELPLSQLSFGLLLALVRAAPNVVTFDQLMERVWPNLVVSQETVSQRVKLVRDALGDDSQAPRYIGGVRGRGYRMVARISPLVTPPEPTSFPEPAAPEAPASTSVEAPPPTSLATPSAAATSASTTSAAATSAEPPSPPPLMQIPHALPPTAPPLGDDRPLAVRKPIAALTTAVVIVVLAVTASILTRYLGTRHEQPMVVQSSRSVLVQQPKTIAVLPLVDLSPSGGNDYIGDGLAQELSSRLARIPGLRVASQTSAFAYKGSHADVRTIGKSLGVGNILEGSVRREGDHVRVTAELIDTASGYHIWSQSYDRSWQDLLVIQDDLSRSIISTLQVVLSSDLTQRVGQPPTAQIAAFDLYLSGIAKLRQSTSADQLDTAEQMFHDALSIDPEFAPAYSGLCERYTVGYERSRDPALAQKAEAACKQALKLDSSLREVEMGLAHLYLGTGRAAQATEILHNVISKDPTDADAYIGLADAYEGQQRTAEAEIAYNRAVESEPTYGAAHTALANFLFKHGRSAAAVPHYQQVTQLAPASATAFNNLGAAQLMSGDFQAAAAALEQSIKLAPTRSAYSNSGTVDYYLGRFADAAEMFRRAAEMAPEDHRVWGNLADALYQIEANRPEAQKQYTHAAQLAERRVGVNPKDASTWMQLAFYYTRLGNAARSASCKTSALGLGADDVFVQYYGALIALEEHNVGAALDFLHRAIDLGYPIQMVRADPLFHQLLQDERFQHLLAAAHTH
jgi:TolB-like protein/Flp pilus assembly protein TadD/DNA-binding winged helix-turn-helix (wHTH) protein